MQFVPAAGLSPPGSISVAPSGIPAPLDPLEPGTPSGDVAPRPGAVINVWASAAPQPSAIATAITSKRCIDVSSALNADGSGQCARASRDKTLARWIGLDPPHLEMVEAARSCSLEIAEDGLRLPFSVRRNAGAACRPAPRRPRSTILRKCPQERTSSDPGRALRRCRDHAGRPAPFRRGKA